MNLVYFQLKNKMRVQIIKCLQDNYSYLIIDETNQNACVVDPSEAKPIIDFVENNNIDLKYILNTHHHFDHVGGNMELKKKYNSNVIGFKDDKDRIPGIDILVDDLKIWKKVCPFSCLSNAIAGKNNINLRRELFKYANSVLFVSFFITYTLNVIHEHPKNLRWMRKIKIKNSNSNYYYRDND